MRLLDPLSHDIARDLHASMADFILRPLAGHLLGACHVDLFGNVDAQRGQPTILNHGSCGFGSHNMGIHITQTLRKRRGREANHPHVGVILDVLDHLLALDVALIDDEQVGLGEVVALLQRLG